MSKAILWTIKNSRMSDLYFISHKKFYRVNLSQKALDKGNYEPKVKEMVPKLHQMNGVVRLKLSKNYLVNEKYRVVSSHIFETQSEKDIDFLMALVQSKDMDWEEEVENLMDMKELQGAVKHELEMRMRASLIDRLRNCSERELKKEVSECFDFMVNLTNPSETSEVALAKMMEKVSLSEESDEDEPEYIVKPKKH